MRFIYLLLLLLPLNLSAQKILQMDMNKFGGRQQFLVGDELEFQLDGQNDWYKYKITDLDREKQEIIFDEIRVPVSRITKLVVIRKKTRSATYAFSSMFGVFGLTWTGYAIYGLIVASPAVGPITFLVGGIALVTGGILYLAKFLWKRKYKINEKRRLRIIDITIEKDRAMVEPSYEHTIAIGNMLFC